MNNLKTLKDIEQWETGYGDFGELELYSTFEHSKESPIRRKDRSKLIHISDLKKEAIKWIKFFKEEDSYDKHYYQDSYCLTCEKFTNMDCKHYMDSIGISWEECSDMKAICSMLKHFFNIAEEDLK